MRNLLLILSLFLFALNLKAESDSVVAKPSARFYTHRDSVYLAKLNSNGNLMIAGGVGLCAAGSFLIYEGNKIYGTNPPAGVNYDSDLQRNHKQGTIYYVVGGISLAAGILTTAFGIRSKIDFKRLKMMELQSGILDNGNLGLALNF